VETELKKGEDEVEVKLEVVRGWSRGGGEGGLRMGSRSCRCEGGPRMGSWSRWRWSVDGVEVAVEVIREWGGARGPAGSGGGGGVELKAPKGQIAPQNPPGRLFVCF
jgi:hypothetical protein